RNFFTKKFQREIDINVEAVKDAQAIINPLLESSDLTEAETQEAQKIKAQLDHTHVYYEWLEQLTEAIESGEIFKYFPIPEQPSDTEN
ncbi:TPA: GbsR/MarR family transcriptional regulator, partial [Staphylococcus aureus]|nr:GbsR/MarR family transcriptional regulator [Staphylococcus aureus]